MKQYTKVEDLIEDVRKIDPGAAPYLDSDAQNLSSWSWIPEFSTLSTIFIWHETPQGWDFWNHIDTLLEELHNE